MKAQCSKTCIRVNSRESLMTMQFSAGQPPLFQSANPPDFSARVHFDKTLQQKHFTAEREATKSILLGICGRVAEVKIESEEKLSRAASPP